MLGCRRCLNFLLPHHFGKVFIAFSGLFLPPPLRPPARLSVWRRKATCRSSEMELSPCRRHPVAIAGARLCPAPHSSNMLFVSGEESLGANLTLISVSETLRE